LPIVRALAGDSTITSALPLPVDFELEVLRRLFAGAPRLARPHSAYSPLRTSVPTLAASGGTSGPTLDFEKQVVQFALPLPYPNATGFSPWQLRPYSPGAARGGRNPHRTAGRILFTVAG
jgi:hypothetical protein